MDLLVVVRQTLLARPPRNLFGRAIGSPVAVRAAAIALLKEPLVIALELVVQNDALDARALIAQPLLGAFERAINGRIVRPLARLSQARVERLARLVCATIAIVAVGFQELTAAARQGDRAVVGGPRRRAEQPCPL